MSKVHILGIGSPSGDDQAGWLTVDALAACGVHAEHELVIEKLDRPGAGLVSRLDSDWVILVDAMQGGAPPGTIRCFEQDTWPDYAQGLSSHGFGVLDALLLAQALARLPRRLQLYGIENAARQLAQRIADALDAERVIDVSEA